MRRSAIEAVRSGYRRLRRDGLRGLARLLAPRTEPSGKADAEGPSGYVESQLQKATELLQARRLEEAERILNEALTRRPNHPALLDCLARVAQRDGRWPDALRHWQTLSAADPNRAEASLNQVKMLNKLRRFAEAEQLLQGAGERWPDHPKVIEALAAAAERDLRWVDALAHWQDLTLRRPGRLPAWLRRIEVLVRLGRTKEANEVLRSALERWPNHPELDEARAHALESEQRWAEALTCWRDLSNDHPSHAAELVGQHTAMCEIKLGRVGDAGRSLEAAIGARQEAAILQRMFGSQARFVSYYGRRIEDAFRDLR